jgi:tRNA threonylcarbamoyladenosine biosynthesis protein TsaE
MTRQAGARLAAEAQPGDVFGLEGELGAGKTELVRGFVSSLNPAAPVRSPSFALVYTYETQKFPIHHFDFYRLNDPDELIEIGFDEYLRGDAVCLIEWADLFPEFLPPDARRIRFFEQPDGTRAIDG